MVLRKITTEAGTDLFIQEHSVLIRVWHWLTFLVLLGSMVTVLLNSTILKPQKNVDMVMSQLKAKGATVTAEQAFAVSHEYEEKIWEVHKLLGFGLLFLLFSRIVIEIVQPGEEKIRTRFMHVLGLYRKKDKNRPAYRHYLGVKWVYLLFYLLLLCMALTGLGMAFGRDLSFPAPLRAALRTVHGIGQYLIYSYVFVHICGVVIADNSIARGVVSGMINGNRGVRSKE